MRMPKLAVVAFALAMATLTSAPPKLRFAPTGTPPMLAREELLRLLGRGHLNLLADYYWIQEIQAAGIANDQWTYRDPYFYGDLATNLDPRFRYVYAFTAAAITFNTGRERWVNTEESTAILEKGLKVYPNDVPIRVLYAFNLSYYHGRYLEAAEVLRGTIGLPGAPPYLARLATRLFAQGGRVETGLELAQAMYEASNDPEQREQFERRVLELQLERVLQRVDEAITGFKSREGRVPTAIAELIASGDLTETPEDPLGGHIYIGDDGRSRSNVVDERLEIHRGSVE